MTRVWMGWVAGMAALPMMAASHGQAAPPRDAWLMQNYHFTGPPAPGTVKPTDPVLGTIGEMQSILWQVMQRAKFDEDYGTVMAAAAETVANAQLMEAITEHRQAVAAATAPKATTTTEAAAPAFFLIAMKDKTIVAARSYRVDGPMLNYVTLQGAHVTVRLDLVDGGFSEELNRQRGVAFRLPR